jgi:YesN/AraC family two-component response regulator
MMPVIDGMEMIEIIRHNPTLTRLPILICSAAKDLEHVRMAAKFNVQGYILKPINRETLLGRIATILDATGQN